jgi:predicted nucleic acid-binding protein
MRYLLDVNALVAWGWADHLDHDRTAAWIADVKAQRAGLLCTSSIPQLGFVRVSMQRSRGLLTVRDAADALAGLIAALGKSHVFLADDLQAGSFPGWCQSAARTTDAHLLQLAQAHGMELATLDRGVPGAFLIPS